MIMMDRVILRFENTNSGDIEEGGENDEEEVLKDDGSKKSGNNSSSRNITNSHSDEEEQDNNLNMDISLDEETMDSFLTQSIRKSLSAENEEVREAAQRLLRNRMIEVDRISERSGSCSGDESIAIDESEGLGWASATSSAFGSAYGAVNTADTTVLRYSSMAPMGGGMEASSDSDNNNLAGETTSLLGNSIGDCSSVSSDLLRPSIFTAAGASMGETTSLLGNTRSNGDKKDSSSINPDLLRPSIFTTDESSLGAMNNFG